MSARARTVSPRTRTSFWSRLLYPFLVVATLLVALIVYAWVQGEVRNPFGGGVLFAFGRDQAEQPRGRLALPEGTVAVYACPRALPAFTKITRDHLLTEDGLHTVPVVPEAIEANGLFAHDMNSSGMQRLLGRVLKREKPVNYAFTESDFLPRGTRPGLSAGIPQGYRGIWIDVQRVHGLADAQAGDRVDLIAAEAVSSGSDASPAVGDVVDPVMRARMMRAAATAKLAEKRQASSWVLAHAARVVQSMRIRETAALPGEKGEIVEEVFVAMKPEEVSRFSQALAREVSIEAAPRSSRPETELTRIEDQVPESAEAVLQRVLNGGDEGAQGLGTVEVIRGGERTTMSVPRAAANKAPSEPR